MEENKICPIMSRPCDEDPIRDDGDRKVCEDNGFTIIEKIPWRNIFPCVQEKCMAWVPIKYRCQLAWESQCPDEDSEICDLNSCPKCVKVIHEEGRCRIMEGGEEI